ncbi:MAG: 16S rRNA (cytosine(967)-C(5))-methyltransferase RsmB [Lentisphaerota bacterium]
MTPREPHKKSARQVAGEMLDLWLRTDVFPEAGMESLRSDRAFVMETVYGVLRWRRSLDWILDRMLHRQPRPAVKAALLLGVYQLLFMDHVEEYAVVNETVNEVRRAGGDGAAAMANAVLRRLQRERARVMDSLGREPLGVRMSHPDGLIERWTSKWGKPKTEALCLWNNQRPSVCVQVFQSRVTSDELIRRWAEQGLQATRHPFKPETFLVLPHGVRIPDLPGYAEGWFAVQDPSTLMSVELLSAQPGEDVLDACAAPGGKTSLLAERMMSSGRLAAVEYQEDRCARLIENMKRMKWPHITTVHADARDRERLRLALEKAGAPAIFDRILLDVPCTNTGVLRRRVDARWRFSPQRLSEMTRTQGGLLDGAAPFLKTGGSLVYSTCSLEPEENHEMVAGWVKTQTGFELVEERLLFPPDTKTDGAYAALMVRSKK